METSSSQSGCACDPHIPCFLSPEIQLHTTSKGEKIGLVVAQLVEVGLIELMNGTRWLMD